MALELIDGSLFLHVPKTGGSWVSAMLSEQGLVRHEIGHKHADYIHLSSKLAVRKPPRSRIKNFLRRGGELLPPSEVDIEDRFTFCFVRHPATWYESWFTYMTKNNWRKWGLDGRRRVWHPNSMLDGLGATEFGRFVRNCVDARPGYVSEMFGWYTMPGISFVGKQEQLVDDLIAVLRMRGFTFDEAAIRAAERINTSRGDVAIAWPEGLREEVVRLEVAALMRYGYEE